MKNFIIPTRLLSFLQLLQYTLCFVSNANNHNRYHSKTNFQRINAQLSAKISQEPNEPNNSNHISSNISALSRRNVLQKSIALSTLLNIKPSNSMGLVQFPCKEGTLSNTYNVMRAGESLLEESNLYATNPLFLTNREAALSPKGLQQIRSTCQLLLQASQPTVVYFALAAKCVDTSDMIVEELKISRNRVLPEFTFLDQRSIGLWDMLALK